jgi:hypothetical protein
LKDDVVQECRDYSPVLLTGRAVAKNDVFATAVRLSIRAVAVSACQLVMLQLELMSGDSLLPASLSPDRRSCGADGGSGGRRWSYRNPRGRTAADRAAGGRSALPRRSAAGVPRYGR